MSTSLTFDEVNQLNEILSLLEEAYTHYFEVGDGHCKSADGEVRVSFGNYWDRRHGERSREIEIYSSVLGPRRRHCFPSIPEALEAVRQWHRDELDNTYND